MPKGKRKDAYSKFEQKMIDLHKATAERLEAIPARYKRLLTDNIYILTDRAYANIILADEIKPKDRDKTAKRDALLREALEGLQNLQQPLWVFWDIRKYEERRMAYWAGLINEEALILRKVIGDGGEVALINTISWKKVQGAEFLRNMSELHRYTYSKVSHAPKRYYGYVSAEIIKCADSAWCSLLLGDAIFPETQKDAKRRACHFKDAMEQLNQMQRPLHALWNVESYSEREMDEWAGMVDKELRLISGLLKSDAKRYGELK